jgi:sugar phosphate permease
MFYRVSNAVIAPKLVQDLGLNAETLGIIGEAFFYCFALLQIPMGPMPISAPTKKFRYGKHIKT